MSVISCPISGSIGSECPVGKSATGTGPRGCAFSGFGHNTDIHAAFGIPIGADANAFLRARERKTLNELLNPKTIPIAQLKDVKAIDPLAPTDADVLAAALGAPARQVILRAEEIGPATGWKDGYLSAGHGFMPPDPSAAPTALANSHGRVWSDLCERMPGCVARGRVRESIAALPVVKGTPDVIPDAALWAATVALGTLCTIYRYEERQDGSEGIKTGTVNNVKKIPHDESVIEELRGLPLSLSVPFYDICLRMGRTIPYLGFYDVTVYNYKLRDPTSEYPYVARFDNMDIRWPMFGDRDEISFLKGAAEVATCTQHSIDLMATCQEHVMTRNVEGLLRALVDLKEIIDRLPGVFHGISLNPNAGENYISPFGWSRWAKFTFPLSKRCPAISGLQMPPFLLMDAFLGRRKYDSFLGVEGLHLRAWLPANHRAFIAAIESHYSIPDFVKASGDQRLMGVLEGIVESYTGERGFGGTHRYKVWGFLELSGKTGRTDTNGNSGASQSAGRPWEEVHKQFSLAMKERLQPYRGDIPVEPHQMRGTFEECRFKSRVLSRSNVDEDPSRSIAMVTLDIQDTGITFRPGDRLAVMPLNSWIECAKVAAALGLDAFLENPVPLDKSPSWKRYAEHSGSISGKAGPTLTVADILRRGHLASLPKDLITRVHTLLRASSNSCLRALASNEFPVRASLGDLLQAAVADTSGSVWDTAFDLSDLSWLPNLIDIEVPRTYSIASFGNELLPSTVDLAVSRSEYQLSPIFAGSAKEMRSGVSSGFLNPPGQGDDYDFAMDDEELLIGISRPLNFHLPLDPAAPIGLFAGGSGIAPFRSFWQARIGKSVGKNILFLGVQSRQKFVYENELREYVRAGAMEVHTAFSRDSNGLVYNSAAGDLVEKQIAPRYIDSVIVEQGQTVCDLVMSKKQGGLGGYIYVCGSVSVFDTVLKGLRKAIYENRTASMESAESLLAIAFAERRFMLDIFMTPQPLSCALPTISLSQLAINTGHRKGGRMWIAVHGSVYDVTDFLPMHPGGTHIVESNAGIDCSKAFDELAHTNNPEVSSFLTKYFIGHLTPKPDFRSSEELSQLYDMWQKYLRTAVETLTCQSFEVDSIMGDSNTWSQGSLFNMGGVRKFYQYQSRLMQGGFSALFGANFQEIYLKLSFSLVNSATVAFDARLPDVLGIIGRAKSSAAAMNVTKEVAQIGQFVCDSQNARFHEQGIVRYAQKMTAMGVEFLEGVREDVGKGMDAFDVVGSAVKMSDMKRTIKLCAFLMEVIERMANRFEAFYAKMGQQSIYQPRAESNPARARWGRVRQLVKAGSFFVLATDMQLDMSASSSAKNFRPDRSGGGEVDFTHVITAAQRKLENTSRDRFRADRDRVDASGNLRPLRLAEAHLERGNAGSGGSEFENHEDNVAIKRMSSFINTNMKAIRRMSRMPTSDMNYQTIMDTYGRDSPPPPPVPALNIRSTPSRSSSRSGRSIQQHPDQRHGLPRSPSSARSTSTHSHGRSHSRTSSSHTRQPSPLSLFAPGLTQRRTTAHQQSNSMSGGRDIPTPPSLSASPSITALSGLMSQSTKLVRRGASSAAPKDLPSPPSSVSSGSGDSPRTKDRGGNVAPRDVLLEAEARMRSGRSSNMTTMTGSLRSFKLGT